MLTSTQNPLVKSIRKLHQSKVRRSQQQFLLEGTHLIQEALQVSYPIDVSCFTSSWAERYPQLAEALQQSSNRSEMVADEVLQSLATTVNPDGVIAVAPQRLLPPPPVTHLGLVVETLQDPGNLGTIIRTGVAAGVEGLWLSQDSVAPDHPKVLRASAGQWFHLPMIVSTDLVPTVRQWRHKGFQVVATAAEAPIEYWAIDFTHPTIVLLGNEGAGLSQPLQELATVSASIPMAGSVESLNVAISAALLVYEARRQRRQSLK
jgi:TrmH family RNA methyltransferase